LTITCGIDWAENHHDVALVDEAGQLVTKRHTAAMRHVFNRLLGCLHHCLATGQKFDPTKAFPALAPATT
jgi:hypothetical protein